MSEFLGAWNELGHLRGKRISTYVIFRLHSTAQRPQNYNGSVEAALLRYASLSFAAADFSKISSVSLKMELFENL